MEYCKRQKKEPNCETCEKPFPILENRSAYEFILKYTTLFVDGMSGINAGGIALALDIEGIPIEERSFLTQKILLYVSTALEEKQRKEKMNG